MKDDKASNARHIDLGAHGDEFQKCLACGSAFYSTVTAGDLATPVERLFMARAEPDDRAR